MHPSPETWRKVGVTEGQRVVLLHQPPTWDAASLPHGVRAVTRRGTAPGDVVVAFYGDLASLRREVATLPASVTPTGMVWVAWPRRAGGHESDLGDAVVREAMLSTAVLVDVKVAALDDDWSALKFVWRVRARPR